MTTHVQPVEFTPAGLEVPQASDVLAGVMEDINDAFGGTLTQGLNTPQGQLASSNAAIVNDANAVFAEFVNQVNPDTADGFMQDAIARIYFLTRSPGAPTVVQCLCTGLFGTIIPVGAEARDSSGNRYVCTAEGIIPFGGSITLPFANILNGPIPCAPNTLTTIVRAVIGWDTINNPSSGALGRDVESRAEFEYRRSQSVALNARGSLPSIYAAVFDVEGVLDVYATENVTNAPLEVGSTDYELVPHSLYVAVVGGNQNDIAQAIWSKKDVGCDYNGNTTVVVQDDSGYDPPYPQYDVSFEIPASLPILFEVELAESDDLPDNIEALVKAAIIAEFNGTGVGNRVRIGSLLLASKFYPAVIGISPDISVLSILIGTVTPTLTSILIGIDQAPTVSEDDIVVTIVS